MLFHLVIMVFLCEVMTNRLGISQPSGHRCTTLWIHWRGAIFRSFLIKNLELNRNWTVLQIILIQNGSFRALFFLFDNFLAIRQTSSNWICFECCKRRSTNSRYQSQRWHRYCNRKEAQIKFTGWNHLLQGTSGRSCHISFLLAKILIIFTWFYLGLRL